MIENETDLVKTSYLDSLAVLQQTRNLENAEHRKKFLAEKRSQEEARKKERDKKIVNIYLKEKFPDAFSELGINGLSEKEFPSILKRAKRHFRLWLAGTIAVSSSFLGGGGAAIILSLSSEFLIFVTALFMAIILFAGGMFIRAISEVLISGKVWPSLPDDNSHTPSLGGS